MVIRQWIWRWLPVAIGLLLIYWPLEQRLFLKLSLLVLLVIPQMAFLLIQYLIFFLAIYAYLSRLLMIWQILALVGLILTVLFYLLAGNLTERLRRLFIALLYGLIASELFFGLLFLPLEPAFRTLALVVFLYPVGRFLNPLNRQDISPRGIISTLTGTAISVTGIILFIIFI